MCSQHRLRKIWICFLLHFFVLSLLSGRSSYGVTRLRLGLTVPWDHPWAAGIRRLKNDVELASSGKLTIDVISGPKIANPRAALQKVQAGSIDMALLSTLYLGEVVEAMKIFRLPFVFRDKAQANLATTGSLGGELLKETEKQGLIGLTFVPSEYRVLINTVKPISKPQDFKGLHIRTQADPITIETFKALGASPFPIAWTEMYSAISRGVVNAGEFTPHGIYALKLYEVAKYLTVLPINYYPGVIIADARKWARMSLDQKNSVENSIPVVVEAIGRELDRRSDMAFQKMKQKGVNVYYPDDISPFRNAVKNFFVSMNSKIPRRYRKVAYNSAYVKRELQVCSKPHDAEVFYRRHGDRTYEKYHELTDTSILLEFAVWQIRVEKKKYYPEEKYFDPHSSRRWRIDFSLQEIK